MCQTAIAAAYKNFPANIYLPTHIWYGSLLSNIKIPKGKLPNCKLSNTTDCLKQKYFLKTVFIPLN